MSKIGYARCSTVEQVTDGQEDRLRAAGCARIFIDHGVSGRLARRPEWDRCLDHLREGDVLVVTKLDRVGRSLANLIEVINYLGGRGIDLLVLDQAIDTTTPGGKFLFHIMGAVAEFEADLIRSRTRDGLAAARARGRTGGRKPKLSDSQFATVRSMYEATGDDGKRRFTVQEIADAVGVHRTVVYDYLKRDRPPAR